MDIEVVEAIESLREDIRRVETSLRADIGNEVGKLRAEMVTKDELRRELGKVRAEMATRVEMAAMREELIRRADVLHESVHDDIRVLAEGFAMLSTKIDRITPPRS